MKFLRLCIAASLALDVRAQRHTGINVVEESAPMSASQDPIWWVNSGAYFNQLFFGIGFTVLGQLPDNNQWRILYAKNNPKDTDMGYHPQNIFRLVTRKEWKDFTQWLYFYIACVNVSDSENRNESNGVLFFNRYKDGDNLYYVGVRVDGHVVIKKKAAGVYYTLAYPKALYSGVYDRVKNPNLLPEKKWIGIRSAVKTIGNAVSIQLYVDREANGKWELAAEATDDGTVGGAPLLEEGHAGIRADFMDVIFLGYGVIPIE